MIRDVLSRSRTIAIVGCSRDPSKDAHKVPKFLKEMGYEIIPVNPFADVIIGEKTYPNLLMIPEEVDVDIVDVFRPSKEIALIVDQAVSRRVKVIWLQIGIRNNQAAERAISAGLVVVQDRCIMREYLRLFG